MVLERIKRGLRMDIESLKVLARFPRLLAFPLVSAVLVVGMWAAVFGPLLFGFGPDLFEQDGLLLVLGLTLYFASFFVAFVFEAALIDAAADHFRGDEVDLGASLREVWGRKGPIFVWAVIAGTVGLVLRFVARRTGVIGRIVISAIGLVWNLATLLVLPTLLYEDVGAWDGLKRSVDRFKERWGEVTTGVLAMGALFGLLGLAAALVGGALLFVSVPTAGIFGLVTGIAVLALLIGLVALARAAAGGIFVAAVYNYVQTGEVPEAYTRENVTQPFVAG